MKTIAKVNLVLLTLLSLASGASKIVLLPQEVEFFGGAGFSSVAIVLYGAAQFIGGVLLIFGRTRFSGAIVMAVTFAVSTILIFLDGKIGFGLFSLLPIAMSVFVMKDGIADSKAPF